MARRAEAGAASEAGVGPDVAILRDRVDGTGIRVAMAGAEHWGRPPILLIHGLAVSSDQTWPAAARFGRHRPACTIDLEDDSEGSGSRLGRRVAAAEAWIDRSGRHDWIVLGSSLGSQAAVELALRSSRVRAIVLAPPAIEASPPRPWRQLARTLRASMHEPMATNLLVLRAWLSQSPVGPLRSLDEALRYPMAERLRRVRRPILLVSGTRDALTPSAWLETLVRASGSATNVRIEGASHALPHSAPEPLVRAVEAFADEHVQP